MVREILALGVFILKNAENSVADAKYVIERGFEIRSRVFQSVI